MEIMHLWQSLSTSRFLCTSILPACVCVVCVCTHASHFTQTGSLTNARCASSVFETMQGHKQWGGLDPHLSTHPLVTPVCLDLSQSLAGRLHGGFVRGSLTERQVERWGRWAVEGEGRMGGKTNTKSVTNITDAHTRSLIYKHICKVTGGKK